MSTPRITGIHHYCIHARDFQRSVAFWTGTMGFTEKLRWTLGDGRDAAMLDCGDGNYLELFATPNVDDETGRQTLNHIALRCEGIDGVLQKVRAAGLEVTMNRTDLTLANTAKGTAAEVPIRIAFFTGPEGETIELFENELT